MQNLDENEAQLEYFYYNDVVHCGSIDNIIKLNSTDPFSMGVATMGIEYVTIGS